MKRVAGLPGEKLSISEGGVVVIDGKQMPPPQSISFLHYYAYGPKSFQGAITDCGTGFFVLGDDSKDSDDSRYEGPFQPKQIRGRPLLRVWPLLRFGWVNP